MTLHLVEHAPLTTNVPATHLSLLKGQVCLRLTITSKTHDKCNLTWFKFKYSSSQKYQVF